MALTTAQLALLKTEIETDPTGLGYAASVALGADGTIAEILNLPRAGIQFFRESVSAREIFEAIDGTEFSAMSAANLSRLQILLGQAATGGVDLRGANVRSLFASVFPNNGPTRPALVAISKRDGSRAEQVLGQGVVVDHADVSHALRGA